MRIVAALRSGGEGYVGEEAVVEERGFEDEVDEGVGQVPDIEGAELGGCLMGKEAERGEVGGCDDGC